MGGKGQKGRSYRFPGEGVQMEGPVTAEVSRREQAQCGQTRGSRECDQRSHQAGSRRALEAITVTWRFILSGLRSPGRFGAGL